MDDVHVFKELKGDVPVRVLVSHTSSSGKKRDSSGLGVVDVFDVMDHAEKGFLKASKVIPRGEEVVTGRKCLVFGIEGVDEDGVPFKGTACIDLASARPVKADYVQDVTHAPSMIKALSYSVIYGSDFMPAKVTIDFTFSVLFGRFRTVIQQDLSEWASRKEQTASARK
jgi:hypothetical protein